MKYTILVNSCDSYSDLWEPFFQLLKKYWKGNMPPIVLNTETKDFSMEGLDIVCVHCPDNKRAYYGKRMKYVLKQIETEYVLCLLDDFFVREEIDVSRLESLINEMDINKNICCFNFDDSFSGIQCDRYPEYIFRPLITDYKLNMQAAIWRRKDLDGFWKDKVSPWEWETISNKLTYSSTKEFYYLKRGCDSPINYGKKTGPSWGVVHGKWVEQDVVPLFEKEGIKVDYSIRGFYEPILNRRRTVVELIRKYIKYAYILGPRFTINSFCYTEIYSRSLRILGKKTMTYDQYLARKYNARNCDI